MRPSIERGRRRLAEVVADRAEHHGDRAAADRGRRSLARLVDHHQRVRPHVAFGMPLRLLLAADERPHLGQHAVDRRRGRARARSRSTAASAWSSSFSISPQIRSAGRSSSGMRAAQRRGVVVERRTRSARRTASRAARAGCRRRTSRDRRRAAARRSRSPRPSNGSSYAPVSGSHAMALIVKSRRRAASAIDIDGSPCDLESLVPASALRLAARQRHVDVADVVSGTTSL